MTVDARPASAPWRAFGLLAIGVFLSVLDLFIVSIAFPAIEVSFPSASLSSLSWILSAYAIVYAAVLVPAGKLADIVGRKRVFLAGLFVFLLGSALCAAASLDANMQAKETLDVERMVYRRLGDGRGCA